MPLFEYQCRGCGHVTEFLEKPGSRAKHTCEQCGDKNMDKLLSTFSARVSQGTSSVGGSSCPTGTCPLS